MKMYILVKNTLSPGIAAVSIAHASLGTYLTFQGTAETKKWLSSFKKVVCSVSPEEFEEAKKLSNNVVFTESSLDPNDNQTCIGFEPREVWPEQFKKYKLYGIKEVDNSYTPNRICVVSGRGDLAMSHKEFVNKVCVIIKKTKSGLIQVRLRDNDRKIASVPQSNISFKDYPIFNRLVKDEEAE